VTLPFESQPNPDYSHSACFIFTTDILSQIPFIFSSRMHAGEQLSARRGLKSRAPLLTLLVVQGASGWHGVGSLVDGSRHASAHAGFPVRAAIARKPEHGSQLRAGGAAVPSMILGEKPVIESTGLNRCGTITARCPHARAPLHLRALTERYCSRHFAPRSRRISASILISRPPEDVWSILTDYDNLATHVPNLVASKRLPHPTGSGTGKIRLYQEGAQKIWGFDFSASLVMDMEEFFGPEQEHRRLQRKISFKLIQSAMLAQFDGEWAIQPHSRTFAQPTAAAIAAAAERREPPPPPTPLYSTKLIYSVNVTPRGMVPVPAIEWRIREDVPLNLRALKLAAEKLPLRPIEELLQKEKAAYAARAF
jgi:hypothetical protein